MILSELGPRALRKRLADPGLCLRTGPVVSRVFSTLELVAAGIELHYANHTVEPGDGFSDFHVTVERPGSIRALVRPQVVFRCDVNTTFNPLPADQAFPVFEWGMNWCVTSHCHQYLIVHSAVVERNGGAAIFPAPPGSGKSTLCACLVNSGWRLLSDELAVIDFADGSLVPVPRPVSLKNKSIEVIARFAPAARFSPTVHDTLKGSVAHMCPPADSVLRQHERTRPRWLVLPRYAVGATARLEPLGRARAFMHLVENGFNFDIHGARAFDQFAALIDECDCYEFTYSRLEDAVEVFDRLAGECAAGRK